MASKSLIFGNTFIITIFFLISCRESVPAANVLLGNASFRNGQYQKAIQKYLEAQETATADQDVVYYNLGNVYYALGEGDAALKAWEQAENATAHIDTLFRIAFNRGVLYYLRGHYTEAYHSFRRALELNPLDIDSKINLEDSLSHLQSEALRPAAPETIPNAEYENGTNRLLDYIKRKEAENWSIQDSTNENMPNDW